ncbi:hypothetical protein EU528_08445 [Candidatus Thorarchaeota archaeon]|nr:MAG: hypothetical protein EU528_08445 [Candidatus Thorarchaeota archaeon]
MQGINDFNLWEGWILQLFDAATGLLVFIFAILAIIICCLLCGNLPETNETSTKTRTSTRQRSPPEQRYPSRVVREPPFAPRPIPGVSHAVTKVTPSSPTGSKEVKALRGGEFVGNRMRFKVKVLNDTPYTITDVRVFLISYPSAALRLASDDDDEFFPKIEPAGFRSPTFDFLPTQDCVRGDIVAGVSYIDMTGKAHTLSTRPFVIRAVCDLLIPDQVTPEEFTARLRSHEHGEIVIKVEEWTPEEMFDKALRIVDESNFFEISSKSDMKEGIAFSTITGLAKGKYTGKSVGVQISITGPSKKKGATCIIRVSGEDQAMILPAIDDLKERLSAWLCPLCSSPLTLENVADLKAGKVIECPFCCVSIGR